MMSVLKSTTGEGVQELGREQSFAIGLRPPVLERISVSVHLHIRKATEDDLPALEWMGLFTGHRSIIRETFHAQEHGRGLMLLAVARGFPVGQVWIDLTRREEGSALLWAVRTFNPLQNSGIGAALMRSAEQELARLHIRRAELIVETSNARAARFYERLGWHKAARRSEVIHGRTTDVWEMTKQPKGEPPG